MPTGETVGRAIDRATWASWSWVARKTQPVRLYWWSWWHYALLEPKTAPNEARRALKTLAHYRLGRRPHRLVRVRPGFRRFRFGVLVTIEPMGQSKQWTQRWCRWIEDPIELWLLKSAMAGPPGEDVPNVGTLDLPTPEEEMQGDPNMGMLDLLTSEDMDEFLGVPKNN